MKRLQRLVHNTLFKGTVQLAVAGIFTRLVGLFNRMIMARLMGAEGLGLFQMIIPVYALLVMTMGLGISGAVAKMVADRFATGQQEEQEYIRTLALRIVLIAAIAGALLLWLALLLPLADLIPDRRIVLSIRLMPAACFFAVISSILRSYFQGRGDMTPTALSQAGEQLIRVAVGLAGVYLLLPFGLDYAMLGVTVGIVAGEIACYLVLLAFTRRQPSSWPAFPRPAHRRELLLEMARLALPILAIRLSTTITQTAESLIIPARLQVSGLSPSQATSLFGQLSGMALPLLFLPTVLVIPFNMTLIPAVASAATLRLKKRVYRLVNTAVAGTLFMGLGAAIFLYVFAPPLVMLLYGDMAAAKFVLLLLPVTPFAYLQITTASILHGLGRPDIAVINDLTGTLLSLLIIYYLTANPAYGISGVLWGYSVAFSLIAFLDCLFIYYLLHKMW